MRLIDSVLSRSGPSNHWHRKFLALVLNLMLMVPGKTTFRNLSRYSEYEEKTFSRGFGRAYDWVQINYAAIREVIPSDHEQALVLDASFIGKSGRQTYGLDYFWNGTASRAEKGLEISALGWLDITGHQAYSLSVEQTPAREAVSANEPTTDSRQQASQTQDKGKGKNKHQSKTQAIHEESRIQAYVSQVHRVVQSLPLPWPKYLIVDGYYSKKLFLDGVCELGLDLIGKLRTDADMRYLYTGPRRSGAGAPKRFDGKVDWSDLSRFERIETDQPGVVLYQQKLNHRHFKRTLNVVVMLDSSGKKNRRTIFFSTDLELDAQTLLRYYRARFDIEFLFRDAKQCTGLGQCQARDPDKLHNHFNASLSAVSFAKLEAQQQAGGQLTEPFSIHSLQRRAFNQHFLDQIIAQLDQGQTFDKSSPVYQTLCNYGTISQQAA